MGIVMSLRVRRAERRARREVLAAYRRISFDPSPEWWATRYGMRPRPRPRPIDERRGRLPVILGGNGLTTAELITEHEAWAVEQRAAAVARYTAAFGPAFEAAAEFLERTPTEE